MSITTLPPELLYPILTDVLSSKDFKARDVARIASVCRTFYNIVVKYLYSNCDILLHTRTLSWHGDACYALTLPRFNESMAVMLANALRTFEAYASHRREVKFLSLKTTRGTVLEGHRTYDGPLKLTRSLTDFTFTLATTFTNLTTLTITDNLRTPILVTTWFPIIANILSILTLKHLNLFLFIQRNTKTATAAQQVVESLQPSIGPVANLESLTLDIHLFTRSDRDYGDTNPRLPIWFLSSLPYLFPAECIIDTTTLSFNVTGHASPTEHTNNSYPPYNTTPVATQIPGFSAPANRIPRLTLPVLENLVLSVTEGCPHIFLQYFSSISYRRVRDLEIRDAFELGIDGITALLLNSFPFLRTLSLKKIDDRRKRIDWRFIRTLKATIDTLTTITVYTKTTIPQIQASLGPVFLANSVQNITRERISRGAGETEGSEWKVTIDFAY
ncbi:hypothetical protein TWF281_002810 [Arthrobotrys megalospora]